MKLENFALVAKWVEAELRKPNDVLHIWVPRAKREDVKSTYAVPDVLEWDVRIPHRADQFWMSAEFKFGEHSAQVFVQVNELCDEISGIWTLRINHGEMNCASGRLPKTFQEVKAAA
ncbi:MAG: hypothetical protein DI585_03065 [Pseudomonas fluorescens]|nr:MAG: hypothetical protein DI585_03065 [Pseudomonas fluorescens]